MLLADTQQEEWKVSKEEYEGERQNQEVYDVVVEQASSVGFDVIGDGGDFGVWVKALFGHESFGYENGCKSKDSIKRDVVHGYE